MTCHLNILKREKHDIYTENIIYYLQIELILKKY